MKKLVVLVLLVISSFAYGQKQPEYTDIPFEMYGIWRSVENEFLKIYSTIDGTTEFQRVVGRRVVAKGTIKRVNNELHIIRSDKKDNYELVFVLGASNMVITKPRSASAWLWDKVQ